MNTHFNPRGDLPPTMFQSLSYVSRPLPGFLDREPSRYSMMSSHTLQKRVRRRCYDWIFSSSTNVHLAVDKASFKSYIPFPSYVLTLSDQRKIEVKGIGTVELKIKCKPGSKSNDYRSITLDNVLHVPDWLCNIFSDVYFLGMSGFEYSWTEFGIHFKIRGEKNGGSEPRSFGYTEGFCGLDRLVLSRKHEGSRSPMLEDKEREVFSVNVTWPQSQQDRWAAVAAHKVDRMIDANNVYGYRRRTQSNVHEGLPRSESRLRLCEVSGNFPLVKTTSSSRKVSLRARVSSIGRGRSLKSRDYR